MNIPLSLTVLASMLLACEGLKCYQCICNDSTRATDPCCEPFQPSAAINITDFGQTCVKLQIRETTGTVNQISIFRGSGSSDPCSCATVLFKTMEWMDNRRRPSSSSQTVISRCQHCSSDFCNDDTIVSSSPGSHKLPKVSAVAAAAFLLTCWGLSRQ